MRAGSVFNRRGFLQYSALAGTTLALGSACRGSSTASSRTIKIGYVSPRTGPLAGFGEADDYILQGVKDAFGKGLPVNGQTYPIDIITRDSQSDPNRAATVAGELITGDPVDLMLVASSPETVHPVAEHCEANRAPCIS